MTEVPSPISQRDVQGLINAAATIVNFDMGKKPVYAAAANVSGVRTHTQTFSQRLDSRTIFANDEAYGYLGAAGAWTGADKTAIAACRQVLRSVKVPAKEVSEVKTISEFGASAELREGKAYASEPLLLRKMVRAWRAIDGVPVWDSYVMLGLTRKGAVGHLELHWPEVPAAVIKEAQVLSDLLDRGFKAPDCAGSRMERIEVGIIHSPAIAFFMDVKAAVRAVYRALDPGMGRKPALYLNRHGELVDLPRSITVKTPEPISRPKPKYKIQSTGD